MSKELKKYHENNIVASEIKHNHKKSSENIIDEDTDKIRENNENLNEVASQLREATLGVQDAIKNNYYLGSSKKNQEDFKLTVNNLVSGLEELLR